MYMSDQERTNIIEYLKANTNYSEKFLLGITNRAQLFSMYKRTKERIASYSKEIIAYYNNHPEVYVRPSDEEIRSMKYEELSALRKELGIRAKQGKKVTETTESILTANQARKFIKNQPVKKIVAEVIIGNMVQEEQEPVQEQFLTPEEIELMYPESGYSIDQLAEKGIIVTPYDGATEPIILKK